MDGLLHSHSPVVSSLHSVYTGSAYVVIGLLVIAGLLDRMPDVSNVNDVKAATVPVAYPSIGALIGGVVGSIVAGKFGFNPADPVTGAPIAGAFAAIVSGLFNQLGKWLHLS